jgi:pimeloyl-ACP methyl ester carboxylesterase
MTLHITEQGSGPLVLLWHGWPELAYSWRHQVPALANAGNRVVALDMRGYGSSSVRTKLPLMPSAIWWATWWRWWRRSLSRLLQQRALG